jgi:hypothetical protein
VGTGNQAVLMVTTLLLIAVSLVAPTRSLVAAEADTPAISRQAQEILAGRCMVCHGCYDAPCQLKMEAYEGLERGASTARVYDGGRLVAAPTTRLFDDATTERQWRKLGFYPALQPEDPQESLIYRMLLLKQAHPLASEGALPKGFDFSLTREQQCPQPEDFNRFQSEYPLWGMPYGLPGLEKHEHEVLIDWLQQGSPAPVQAPLSVIERDAVAQWEAFLNGGDNKHKLMSRYLYEHLFLASLYLDNVPGPTWFRLVRSATPPGKPLQLISTRRPYDDPGRKKFYYRLQRMNVTPLRKTHMPYRLDQERMDWYRKLFLEPAYEVPSLPGYTSIDDTNPFHVYRNVPPRSRYEFLLEEAQFTIMNFVKGSVCRGRIALSVIEERFWVMFEDPDLIDPGNDQEALARESENLRLPQPKTGTVIDILSWRRYAKAQTRFLKAKSEYTAAQMERYGLTLDYSTIWDGDGRNPNAALTIFRHFDTASVVKGFVGDIPKTAWVIDYPLLERIHYLLAAGFDVFGSTAHQLESRLYMDFLRMEGEINFLIYMPRPERRRMAKYWYRDAPSGVTDYMDKADIAQIADTGIPFTSNDPKAEFLTTLRGQIHQAAAARYDYRDDDADLATLFERLETRLGAHNQFMPSVSFVNVVGEHTDHVYTIIRDSGYANIAQLFKEDERRLPEEDRLTVVRGFIGAYPNQFFQVNAGELAQFTAAIEALRSDADYDRLLEYYGVARNAPWFWRVSDKLHRMQHARGPIESGLFDYGRYQGY